MALTRGRRTSWPLVGGPRGALIALATLAFVLGTGWWQLSSLRAARAPEVPAPVIEVERLLALVDHDGRPLADADVRGRPTVAFFGFTHCPDVCPMELATIALALDELGPEAGRVLALFVTVDPERDDPGRLKDYVTAFHEHMVGLTGAPEAVARAAAAFGVRYARVEYDDGDYTVDHTARILVLDGDGRLVAALPFASPPEALVEALEPLLATAPVAHNTHPAKGAP